MPRHPLTSLGLAALLSLAAALLGQIPPASTATSPAPPPTMIFDYRDVPLDAVLTDASLRLGFILIRTEQINTKVTLTTFGKSVTTQDAASILNAAVWPLGYRLYGSQVSNGGKTILRVVRRPTTTAPGEMRVWRPVASIPVVGPPPAELPGVSATATMKLQYTIAPVARILDDLGQTFGFVIDPPGANFVRETLLVPQAVHAGEAVGLVSELLTHMGHRLEVVTVEDAKGEKKTLLRVVDLKLNLPKPEVVDFRFDNAPLGEVLAEITRRSGYAVANTIPDRKVTIHATLNLEAAGTDVGPLVAALNETLQELGYVIEETSRADADGKREPVFSVLPLEAARKIVLDPPMPQDRVRPAVKDWTGVDMDATMSMRLTDVRVDQIISQISEKFGFIVMREIVLPYPVTIQNPQPVKVQEALDLLNAALLPMQFEVVAVPSESVKGTVLRVLTKRDAVSYRRRGTIAMPAPTGNNDPLIEIHTDPPCRRVPPMTWRRACAPGARPSVRPPCPGDKPRRYFA